MARQRTRLPANFKYSQTRVQAQQAGDIGSAVRQVVLVAAVSDGVREFVAQ
jgi:hypothetical protein